MRHVLIGSIALLLIASTARAADDSLVVRRYDEVSGLFTTNIRLLLEDAQGFLWCGSEEGLMRFDGNRFTVMGSAESGTSALQSERIQYLFAEKSGAVWIATATRLFRYVRRERRFHSFPLESQEDGGVPGGHVHGIFETADGKIWIVTESALCMYRPGEGIFTHHPYPRSWEIGVLERFSFAEAGTKIWMNVSGNIYAFDRANARISSVDKAVIDPSLRENDLFRFVGGMPDGSFVLVNRVGLYHYDPANGRSRRVAAFSRISIGAAERDGVLWISFDDGGILRWDLRRPAPVLVSGRGQLMDNNRIFLRPTARRKQMPGMLVAGDGRLWVFEASTGLRVFARDGTLERTLGKGTLDYSMSGHLLEDRTGCIWFASQSSALYRIERFTPRFTLLRDRRHPRDAETLPGNNVRAFLRIGGDSVLVASLSGLYVFDRKRGSTHRADFLPEPLAELHSYPVWCLARDGRGRIWIGTGGAGVVVLDPRRGRYRKIDNVTGQATMLSDRNIRCIEIVDGDAAWIGTWGGLDRIDLRRFSLDDSLSPRITSFLPESGNARSLSDELVFDIHHDRSGRLWVATESGINLYEENDRGFRHPLRQTRTGEEDGRTDVRSVFEDARGILWFGTHGDGLIAYDPRSSTSTVFSERDGLPSDIVYGIVGDGKEYLWLSTHRGLCRFNIVTGTTRNFGMRDGLQHLEFNTGAVMHTDDGAIFVGGPEGFNYFQPASLRDLLPPPLAEITRVSINGIEHPLGDSTLALEHTENFLSIEFSAMSNYANETNRYQYMLEGVDASWVYSAGNNAATYTQLSPGSYVFRVRACNAEGAWSPQTASLAIVIRSPWYATDGAKVLYFVSVILFLVGVDRVRRRRVLREERIRSAIREAELRALTDEAEQRALTAVSERREIELERAGQLKGAYAALEQAHENLLTIQQRLSTVVAGAPIVLFALDRDGNFTLSEGAGLDKLGLQPGQMTGQSVFTLYRDYPEILSSMRRALDGEEFTTVNVVNGVAFETRTSALRDENGELTGMIGVALDITEQMQAQQELEKLSRAVEQSPAIVIITDTAGIVEYVNPTFSVVSGYSPEEIIGRTPRLLKSGMQKAEDYRVMWETLQEGRQWRGELHNRRKDGTMFWVSSSISPLKNARGEITHYIGIQEDITERKRTEATLERRTEDLETIDRIVQVVNAEEEYPNVMRTLLEQGMKLLPQAEKCVAFQYDSSSGEFLLIDTLGYDASFVNTFTFTREEIAERYGTRPSRLEEGIYIMHQSSELPGDGKLGGIPRAESSLIIAMEIVPDTGFADGYLVFDSMHDSGAFGPRDAHKLVRFRQHAIIALRRADTLMSLKLKTEEILRTQEQMIVQEKLASLGRLTAGIAHEIQNPLNFVINFAELSRELLDELGRLCEDPARREQALSELRETIGKVYQHSRRAEGIVNSMMMHSRTSTDDRELTDINELVRQSVTLAEHSARSSRAVCNPTISFTLDPGLRPMNIVPIELSRVILNLVENAMDAVCSRQRALYPGAYDAQIHIATAQNPASVDIRIRDNGTGIPSGVLERVFDPFFTTKPPGKGTGLGLSISYDIIRQKYNGTLKVRTEENAFTEFYISIPCT